MRPIETLNSKENIFGLRLKLLRQNIMNKSQSELANILGIPQPTLSAYELGKNKPTIDAVINIADKCNVSIDWLCGRDISTMLHSLGDIVNILFELYETNEFACKTEIHDRVDLEKVNETDDERRNYIQLTFYHNDSWHNPQYTYSLELCVILKHVYALYSSYIDYDYPQDFYEEKKKELIEMYSHFPITKIDFSGLSEEERLLKRLEKIKNELKKFQDTQ